MGVECSFFKKKTTKFNTDMYVVNCNNKHWVKNSPSLQGHAVWSQMNEPLVSLLQKRKLHSSRPIFFALTSLYVWLFGDKPYLKYMDGNLNKIKSAYVQNMLWDFIIYKIIQSLKIRLVVTGKYPKTLLNPILV